MQRFEEADNVGRRFELCVFSDESTFIRRTVALDYTFFVAMLVCRTIRPTECFPLRKEKQPKHELTSMLPRSDSNVARSPLQQQDTSSFAVFGLCEAFRLSFRVMFALT